AAAAGSVLHPEADLHGHLEVAHGPVDDVTTNLGDLEPVEVAQGFAGTLDAIADGLVHALARRPCQLGDLVGRVLAHPRSLTQSGCSGRVPSRSRPSPPGAPRGGGWPRSAPRIRVRTTWPPGPKRPGHRWSRAECAGSV